MASEGKFYLPYLMDKIRALGGTFVKRKLSSLDEVKLQISAVNVATFQIWIGFRIRVEVKLWISGGSRILRKQGMVALTPKGKASIYYLTIFSWKRHGNEKKLDGAEAQGRAPLDPTSFHFNLMQCWWIPTFYDVWDLFYSSFWACV